MNRKDARHDPGQLRAPDHLELRAAVYRDVFNDNDRRHIPPPDHHPLTAIGALDLLQFNLALLVELALKGLLQRQRPLTKDDHIHDLFRLYNRLPEDIRNRLDKRWQQLRAQHVITAGSQTLPQLLQRHRNDFEVWRYHEPDSEGFRVRAEPLQLYLAASAILDRP